MANKKTKQVTEYEVLIACGNSETGATFEPGDIVTLDDFSQAVIDNVRAVAAGAQDDSLVAPFHVMSQTPVGCRNQVTWMHPCGPQFI